MQKTVQALFVSLMILTVFPMGMVQAVPTEASEYYYGVEYDWTSLDNDLENVTGLDIQELFTELMDDADQAGFNLDIAQLTTGASNVYVHQYEDISAQTIQDLDGNDVDVWSRTSDVVLRHGLISDAVFMTDWSETTFGNEPTGFDIDVIATAENVLTVDILYTEYLNADYELVGADMDIDMTISNYANLNLDFAVEGDGEEFVETLNPVSNSVIQSPLMQYGEWVIQARYTLKQQQTTTHDGIVLNPSTMLVYTKDGMALMFTIIVVPLTEHTPVLQTTTFS